MTTLSISAWHTCARILLIGAALGAAACGSKDDDEDATPPPEKEDPKCSAGFSPTNPNALLDDLEDGNPTVAAVGPRNGQWWLASDMTAGTSEPPPEQAITPEHIVGGRCDSTRAIHVQGSGFSDWGAVISANMRYVTASESVDVSQYTGIKFWARLGSDVPVPIRFQVQDAQTRPEGGLCVDDPTASNACWNGRGTQLLPLNKEWRLYDLPFIDMEQADGWGYRTDHLDTSTVYSLEWQLPKDLAFDLWVDDVWFY